MSSRNLENTLKRAYPKTIKYFALLIFKFGLSNHVQIITFYAFESLYTVMHAIGVRQVLKRCHLQMILRDTLFAITRLNPTFTLQIKITDAKTLTEVQRKYGNTLIITAHFGLTMSSHFALLGMGLNPVFIGNLDGGNRDFSGFAWGTDRGVSFIDAQQSSVLSKIGKKLCEPNTAVVAFVDFHDGASLCVSPNLFHWAYLRHIPIVFMTTSPGIRGLININFLSAPFVAPSTTQEAHMCVQSFALLMAQEMAATLLVQKRKI